MLNEYVTKKTSMSTVLKNVDETMKLKRYVKEYNYSYRTYRVFKTRQQECKTVGLFKRARSMKRCFGRAWMENS